MHTMFILIIYLLFWTSDLISSSNELFSSPVGATFPFRFFLGASIEQSYSQISKNIQLLWQYTEKGGKYVSDIYIWSKYINMVYYVKAMLIWMLFMFLLRLSIVEKIIQLCMSSIKKSKSTKILILLESANNAHNRGNAGLLPQIKATGKKQA